MERDEYENAFWSLVDKQNGELEALAIKLAKETKQDPMFRTYMLGMSRARTRLSNAMTEAYVDERDRLGFEK